MKDIYYRKILPFLIAAQQLMWFWIVFPLWIIPIYYMGLLIPVIILCLIVTSIMKIWNLMKK